MAPRPLGAFAIRGLLVFHHTGGVRRAEVFALQTRRPPGVLCPAIRIEPTGRAQSNRSRVRVRSTAAAAYTPAPGLNRLPAVARHAAVRSAVVAFDVRGGLRAVSFFASAAARFGCALHCSTSSQ